MTIRNEVGDDMNAKLVVPPGFQSDGSITYPVLMQVYGGPGSQMVTRKYGVYILSKSYLSSTTI
jgi:dipeptidyl aminopeptidase/acylaminoacyl peptidase